MMYFVTYQVDESKLPHFLNAAGPHGTMQHCHPETDDVELDQREIAAIGSAMEDIHERLQAFLQKPQERLEKLNPQ